MSFYTLTGFLTRNKTVPRFVLFFAYFGYSFAPPLAYFFKISATYGFGLTQITEFIFNPSIILGISMLLVSGYLLLDGKISYNKAVIVGMVLGLVSEIKVYAGVVGICMIMGFALYKILIKKEKATSYILTLIITLLLTAITFIPNNAGAVGLIVHPGFLYEHLMQSAFFNSLNWQLLLTIYQTHHNVPRIIFLYVEAFVLYWFFALGLRSVILFGIVRVWNRKFW